MAINIGPKIGVDGEAEYRKQMNNIIQQAKTLSSEMKAVTSSFSKNDSAQKKTAAQTQVLNKQIEVQKQRVDMLAQGLDKATKKWGEADNRTLKWKQALNEATAELNKMENGLDDVQDGMNGAGNAALSFGDIVKANIISDAIMSGLQKMADFAKQIGQALIDVGKQALSSFSDYEQLTGGISKLFGDAYDTVIADSAQAFKTAGINANDYMESVTGFAASLISGLGGDTAEAARLANEAIADMADNANTFGTSMDSIMYTYQGFAKQNYTMLDNLKLGYGGTQAEMARLVNESGVLGDTMTVTAETINDVSFAKIIEAIHAVQQNLNITGTTSKEASTTIQGSVASMKAAWDNLTTAFATDDLDLSAYVNNFVESVKTAASNIVPRIMTIIPNITKGFSQIMDAMAAEFPTILQGAVESAPGIAQAAISLVQKLGAGIGQAIPQLKETAANMFNNFVAYLQENLPQMISAGLQTLLSFSGSLRENAGQLVDAALNLVRTLGNGIIQSLPALIENIPAIVSNIAGIINDNAPKLLITAGELILNLVKGLIQNIPVIIQNIPQIIKAIVDVIMAFDWLNLGSSLIKSIGNGIRNMAGNLTQTVKSVIQHPIDFIKGLVGNFKNMGQNLMKFLSSGISGMGSSVINAVKNILNVAINWIKSLPSQAVQWGKDFIQGLAGGIISAARGLLDSVKSIANDIASFLHFSRPDRGPLRDYETWMPDMIAGMTDGIYRNAYKLKNAVSSLAAGVQSGMNGGYGAAGASGNTFSVTVNPAKGMSEQQIADMVMQRMQHMVKQRETVFA